MYTGYPSRIRPDQRTVSTSEKQKNLSKSIVIKTRHKEIQVNSLIGIGERLHESLHIVVNKVKMDISFAS